MCGGLRYALTSSRQTNTRPWMSVRIQRCRFPFITFVLMTHFGIHWRGPLSCQLYMRVCKMKLERWMCNSSGRYGSSGAAEIRGGFLVQRLGNSGFVCVERECTASTVLCSLHDQHIGTSGLLFWYTAGLYCRFPPQIALIIRSEGKLSDPKSDHSSLAVNASGGEAAILDLLS